MLIERGAQLDSCNNSGKTALHFATSYQLPECMRFLIQHGCNVNIQVVLTLKFIDMQTN